MQHIPELDALDDWVAASEAAIPGLRMHCAKEIFWPSADRVQADVAVVYVHGFSSSKAELAPVPERLAAALNAPMFATRLTGHGLDGAAMARATCEDWEADIAEALAIGAKLGKRVIVIGCSTGCTLLTLAMGRGADLAGAVMISPNFRMASLAVQMMLMAPGIEHWGSLIVGKERSFPPISDAHAANWTNTYPTSALWPMADAMKKVDALRLSEIKVPALFATCQDDQVVSPRATEKARLEWGGPTQQLDVVMGPGDDTHGHVIAGDIKSPGQTDFVTDAAIKWARSIL